MVSLNSVWSWNFLCFNMVQCWLPMQHSNLMSLIQLLIKLLLLCDFCPFHRHLLLGNSQGSADWQVLCMWSCRKRTLGCSIYAAFNVIIVNSAVQGYKFTVLFFNLWILGKKRTWVEIFGTIVKDWTLCEVRRN